MKTSPWAAIALATLQTFGVAVLFVSLFRLQVLHTAEFQEDQEVQATRRIRVPGARGRILDRAGRILAECRPSRSILCHPEEFAHDGSRSNAVNAILSAIDRLAAKIDLPRRESMTADGIARHLRLNGPVPIVVWEDLDAKRFAGFCEISPLFPGFSESVRPERVYPYGTLAAHVLGYTGRFRGNGDADDRELTFTDVLDLRGRDGVELFYDQYLSGVVGERRVQVDARGLPINRNRRQLLGDGADTSIPGTAGLDLRLTLDVDVQLALERELEGVTGAGVVLDPRDGAVIAMASAPTFDPNRCVPRLSPEVYASLTNRPAKRAQNRAISESYAPGSTFKTITALAALSTGWGADDPYDCCGVYRLGNLRLHCWDRYGHGQIALREALEMSCNSFFCNLGTAIGTNAVISAARAFGLGEATGIDLVGETTGVVPDDAWKRSNYNEPWYPGDVCQMSIGQGMLLCTPLQMAVVAAALANGGRLFTPYLHARDSERSVPVPARTLPFPAEDIELVRQGMRDVAEKGTGKRILMRWVEPPDGSRARRRKFALNTTVAGKTGTAEIGRGATRRKNTWVIAFAPCDNPTIAMAMIVERGESGGSTVAPRVHNVLASIFGEHEVTKGVAQ